MRGNAQWHIPYVSQPADQWWWLPIIPGIALCALPLVEWPLAVTLTVAMAATGAFTYTLFAAEWGGGDNLLAKIINGPTGFHSAAAQITNLRATLANFTQFMLQFEPSSHVRSHPPGDVLLFWWLQQLMAASGGLREATLNFGRGFVTGTNMLLGAGNPAAYIAAAIAAIPLIIGLGRLAAVPFAAVAGRLGAPVLASSLIFLLLPTTTVHTPLLDTVYPLLTAAVLVAGLTAVERDSRWLAGLTGVLFGLSLVAAGSLAAMLIPLVIYAVLRRGSRGLWMGLPFALGWGVAWLALWLGWGINMPAISLFLQQHQRDFEAQRSYWLWFRWKWYDFVMFCGIPVAALCIKFLVESIQRWRAAAPTRLDQFFAGWLAMMVFLWLTPSALAEVGRLWAPLMCFAAIFAAYALPKVRAALPTVLALQIVQIMVINRWLEVINHG
ncbi:MAG: hypothetical protein JO247_22265 [Chloroflexi bacterium]|nr:hypothetical protein [Chloroflexota bacterium]